MPPEDEPESQFDFIVHGHMNEVDSPSAFIREAHAYREMLPSQNGDDPGSDDTIPEINSAAVPSPRLHSDELKSQVEETQYVALEPDTQPSTEFDVSPLTRRVLDNTHSSSASVPPPTMNMLRLDRPDALDVTETPQFRYGRPPKPSMNLTRSLTKPPRPNQEIATMEPGVLGRSSLQVDRSGKLLKFETKRSEADNTLSGSKYDQHKLAQSWRTS
jgi:hypothetical protein